MASTTSMRCLVKPATPCLAHRTISTQTPRFSRVPDWSGSINLNASLSAHHATETTSGSALAQGLSNFESSASPSPAAAPSQVRRGRNETVLGAAFKGRHEALDRVRAADPDFSSPTGMMARRPATADTNLTEALNRFQSRRWKVGDVYSPHDLSPAEMRKWRQSRMPGRDVFDVLGLDPISEWKNYTLLSEYMTTMGRIKHSRDTGLRPVNQRKIAKAIRRAVGMGFMSSVHIHPEMLRRPI